VTNPAAPSRTAGRADRLTWAAVILLAVFLAVLLVQNLGALSLWMDEGFHDLAVQGILDHGYPLFPSGHVYYKAILYTYLLSAISAVFGLSAVSLRILSVLAAAGCVPVLFALGRKLFNRWVGLTAAGLFVLSPWVAEYGRAALYFSPVLLFVLLSLYFFYRGFFEEDKRGRILAAVFMLLTPLIHQLGMVVIFAFPALLLVRGLKRFLKRDVILSLSLVTGFYLLIQVQEFFFWKVGYAYEKSGSGLRGMIDYFFSGFSLAYFQEIYRSFPAMSLAVFAGVFICLGLRAARGGEESREGPTDWERWSFLILCLVFPLFFLCFFRTHIQPRYLYELYGVFLLLFAASAFHLSRVLTDFLARPFIPRIKPGLKAAVAWVLFAGLLLGLSNHIGWARVRAVVNRQYNDDIHTDIIYRAGRPEQEDHENPGLYVRHFLNPDDIVVAIHVVFGYIYAGRADYWLWTGGPGTWDAWEKTATGWRDFYVGARWLDSLAGLKKVIDDNPGRRVWLIASNSLLRNDHISDSIREFVVSRPDTLVFRGKDGNSAVYLWNETPARLTGGLRTLEAEWLPVRRGEIFYGDGLSKGSGLLFRQGRGESFRYEFGGDWPAGRYRMTWTAAADDRRQSDAAVVLNLVMKGGRKLRSLTLSPNMFQASGRYQEFSADFVLPNESRLVLRGLASGRASLRLDSCDLTRLPEDP